jgi:hypothetical protein
MLPAESPPRDRNVKETRERVILPRENIYLYNKKANRPRSRREEKAGGAISNPKIFGIIGFAGIGVRNFPLEGDFGNAAPQHLTKLRKSALVRFYKSLCHRSNGCIGEFEIKKTA